MLISKVNLDWGRCQSGLCNFQLLNLTDPYFEGLKGVYIIWRSVDKRVVRVGQGIIKDRLRFHRSDPAILKHQPDKVTWAYVPQEKRNGVERYLAETLSPLVGDVFPNVYPIQVNIP